MLYIVQKSQIKTKSLIRSNASGLAITVKWPNVPWIMVLSLPRYRDHFYFGADFWLLFASRLGATLVRIQPWTVLLAEWSPPVLKWLFTSLLILNAGGVCCLFKTYVSRMLINQTANFKKLTNDNKTFEVAIILVFLIFSHGNLIVCEYWNST